MRCFLLVTFCCCLWSNGAFAQSDEKKAEPVADFAAPIVEIHVTLVEWIGDERSPPETFQGSSEQVSEPIAELAKADKLRVAQRFQLTTLDRRSVMMQRGERRPRITKVNAAPMQPGGASGTSVVLENIGTLLEITPTMHSPDSILLEISYESSNLLTRKEAIVIGEKADGTPITTPSITTLMLKSTLRVRDGKPMVVVGASERNERLMLIVGAKLLK